MEKLNFRYDLYEVIKLSENNLEEVKKAFSKTKIDIIDLIEDGKVIGVKVNTLGGYEECRFGDLVGRKQNYGMASVYKLNILKAITHKELVDRINEIKDVINLGFNDRSLRISLMQEKKEIEKYI